MQEWSAGCVLSVALEAWCREWCRVVWRVCRVLLHKEACFRHIDWVCCAGFCGCDWHAASSNGAVYASVQGPGARLACSGTGHDHQGMSLMVIMRVWDGACVWIQCGAAAAHIVGLVFDCCIAWALLI